MESILKAVPYLAELSIGIVAFVIIGAIAWRQSQMLEKKDNQVLGVIKDFREDIKKLDKSRAEDNEQVIKAIDHLKDVVHIIHDKGKK